MTAITGAADHNTGGRESWRVAQVNLGPTALR